MTIQTETPTTLDTLTLAQQALESGNQELAFQLCTRLTTNDPKNVQGWLLFAHSSNILEEKVIALNRVLNLNPLNREARLMLYDVMQQLLHRDPFLIYEGEASTLYKVSTPMDFLFLHPKDRAVPETFPPPKLLPIHKAFRLLGWSLLGLLPAGLGTLFIAPKASRAAQQLLKEETTLADRRRARIIYWIATLLWWFALVVAALLIMHLF